VAGLQVGAIATGVVITETIFDWPGLGILLYSGLRARNYPIVQGCVLVIGCIYVLVNLATDITQILINPQLESAQ
jgi:ABC-type dipeptide/oligopeptide/nickel transport system permease component